VTKGDIDDLTGRIVSLRHSREGAERELYDYFYFVRQIYSTVPATKVDKATGV
jgi:hypothetical protein